MALKQILDKLDQTKSLGSSDKQLSYAESIALLLNDKMVEIYLGDQFQQVSFSDYTSTVNAVICGKVKGALGDCLIIESFAVDTSDRHNKKIVAGNTILINGVNIKALTELDGSGSLRDVFVGADKTYKFDNRKQ